MKTRMMPHSLRVMIFRISAFMKTLIVLVAIATSVVLSAEHSKPTMVLILAGDWG